MCFKRFSGNVLPRIQHYFHGGNTILNNELKKFCEENLVDFLGHENIDVTCLGKGKVHPNKKGKAYLAKNVIKFINNIN